MACSAADSPPPPDSAADSPPPPDSAADSPPLDVDAGLARSLTDGMTVHAVLAHATVALRQAEVDSPELDAVLLLADVLSATRVQVLAHPEQRLRPVTAARYMEVVARRCARVPLAYLLGSREFFGRAFRVGPPVLVPRPDTELLVELALAYLRDRPAPLAWAADVGTGSGALAVTLAAERPALNVVATDRSDAALAVAATNAAQHGVGAQVRLVQTDLLAGIAAPLGLIVANLPYVPSVAIDGLMPEVARYEPRLALDGGPDGLVLNRRLLAQARTRLAAGGVLLLEMGHDQSAALRAEAASLFPDADVAVVQDLAGCDRALRVATSKW